MQYFLKTYDPYPLSKKIFYNYSNINKWLKLLNRWIPYEIENLGEGIIIIKVDDDVKEFDKIFLSSERIKLPTFISIKISKKIQELKKELETIKIDEIEKIKENKHITNKLNKILKLHIKNIDFTELAELLDYPFLCPSKVPSKNPLIDAIIKGSNPSS